MARDVLKTMALSAVICVGASAARAATIYVDDASGTIGTVDTSTLAVNVIGSAGVVLTDLAFSPTSQLYGISFTTLYSINTSTGHATSIGSLGVDNVNGLVFGSAGTLYASGYGTGSTNTLYSVNTTTGAATQIGNSAIAGNFLSAGDLAFLNGTLYESVNNASVSDLATLNTTTGAATIVGQVVNDPNLFGLVNVGGTLYGVDGTNLYSVNASTGAGTLIGSYAGHGLGSANGAANALESVTPTPTPTPTPTATPEPASLALLGTALAGLAVGRRNRKSA